MIEAAPVFDYNLGQCFRQLGKAKEAVWHYERFLNRGRPEGQLLDAVNGFVAEMRATLEKEAAAQAEPPPVAPSPTPAPAPVVAPPPPPPPDEPWYADRIGWALTGSGVAGLAVGGALFLDARSLDDDANHNADQRQSRDQHDKADNRRLIGTFVSAGSLGLLAAGVVKLAIVPHHATGPVAWQLSASPSGLVVFGQF